MRLRSQPGGRTVVQPVDEDAKLYVSHMPPTWGEVEVKAEFGRFGEVRDVRVIIDKDTGRSKGYCFVAMGSVPQA